MHKEGAINEPAPPGDRLLCVLVSEAASSSHEEKLRQSDLAWKEEDASAGPGASGARRSQPPHRGGPVSRDRQDGSAAVNSGRGWEAQGLCWQVSRASSVCQTSPRSLPGTWAAGSVAHAIPTAEGLPEEPAILETTLLGASGRQPCAPAERPQRGPRSRGGPLVPV
ncbi:hypothetical protein CapIbe_021118 [Capra ibex]